MDNIISVKQFDRDRITHLFSHTDYLVKQSRQELIKRLQGFCLANLFYEPSTRTSSSFYAAMTRLGGSVIPINEVSYSSVTKGETLEDTVRTLGCYADVIVLRHNEVGAAQRAADVSNVPIINAGDGIGEHPTQALLDLYTIQKERGTIDGLTVTVLGDLLHGRTVHSLVNLLKLYKVKINFIAPVSLQIPEHYYQDLEAFHVGGLLDTVIDETDILYVTRVQKERFEPALVIDYSYGVTPRQLERAKPNMALMHPLPRLGELPIALDSDPRAAYFRQMKNGLHIRLALLDLILNPLT
jgi:aspartate carbamoyltransferase catalytic subunit